MKTTINTKQKEPANKYPWVGAHLGDEKGLIIMFTKEEFGVCLASPYPEDIGERKAWTEAEYKPCEITLSSL